MSGSFRVEQVVTFCRKHSEAFSRFALFLVYFWFGILKLFDASPANLLVANLLERTLPFLSFNQFIVMLGVFEMVIGILWLMRGWELTSLGLLLIHLLTTTGPLVLLPAIAWQGWFVPSLEGQYIIKNILILAVALSIVGRSRGNLLDSRGGPAHT